MKLKNGLNCGYVQISEPLFTVFYIRLIINETIEYFLKMLIIKK